MPKERLQKILARAGAASRRAAEVMITERRVRVNGRIVAELGAQADPVKDRIELDGKRLVSEKPVYYLLNKPRQVVTTMDDPEGRDTVATLVRRIPERVFPVGRLDYHTSGALLLTNDGEMAQALLHPRKGVPKSYVVKVRGHLPIKTLETLRNGVDIGAGERTGPAELFVLREERGNTWLSLTITEGKNRQIHRMVEAVGHRVQRLSRVAFAGLTVEGLAPGAYRPVSGDELRKLKRDYRNPSRSHRAAEGRRRQAEAAYGEVEEAPAPRRRPPGAPARRRSPAKRGGAGGSAGERQPRGPSRKKTATRRKPWGDALPERVEDAVTDEWGAPAKGKRGAPAKGKRGAPARDKRGAPAKRKGGAPARGKRGASSKDEREAPAKDKRGAPAKDKRGAPAKDKRGAPAKGKRGAPAKGKRKR